MNMIASRKRAATLFAGAFLTSIAALVLAPGAVRSQVKGQPQGLPSTPLNIPLTASFPSAVTSADPASLSVVPGASEVRAVLRGANLTVDSIVAEVVKGGKTIGLCEVTLEPSTDQAVRAMRIKAASGAAPGRYRLRLKAGGRELIVPESVFAIEITPPSLREQTGPRPAAAKPMTKAETAPSVSIANTGFMIPQPAPKTKDGRKLKDLPGALSPQVLTTDRKDKNNRSKDVSAAPGPGAFGAKLRNGGAALKPGPDPANVPSSLGSKGIGRSAALSKLTPEFQKFLTVYSQMGSRQRAETDRTLRASLPDGLPQSLASTASIRPENPKHERVYPVLDDCGECHGVGGKKSEATKSLLALVDEGIGERPDCRTSDGVFTHSNWYTLASVPLCVFCFSCHPADLDTAGPVVSALRNVDGVEVRVQIAEGLDPRITAFDVDVKEIADLGRRISVDVDYELRITKLAESGGVELIIEAQQQRNPSGEGGADLIETKRIEYLLGTTRGDELHYQGRLQVVADKDTIESDVGGPSAAGAVAFVAMLRLPEGIADINPANNTARKIVGVARTKVRHTRVIDACRGPLPVGGSGNWVFDVAPHVPALGWVGKTELDLYACDKLSCLRYDRSRERPGLVAVPALAPDGRREIYWSGEPTTSNTKGDVRWWCESYANEDLGTHASAVSDPEHQTCGGSGPLFCFSAFTDVFSVQGGGSEPGVRAPATTASVTQSSPQPRRPDVDAQAVPFAAPRKQELQRMGTPVQDAGQSGLQGPDGPACTPQLLGFSAPSVTGTPEIVFQIRARNVRGGETLLLNEREGRPDSELNLVARLPMPQTPAYQDFYTFSHTLSIESGRRSILHVSFAGCPEASMTQSVEWQPELVIVNAMPAGAVIARDAAGRPLWRVTARVKDRHAEGDPPKLFRVRSGGTTAHGSSSEQFGAWMPYPHTDEESTEITFNLPRQFPSVSCAPHVSSASQVHAEYSLQLRSDRSDSMPYLASMALPERRCTIVKGYDARFYAENRFRFSDEPISGGDGALCSIFPVGANDPPSNWYQPFGDGLPPGEVLFDRARPLSMVLALQLLSPESAFMTKKCVFKLFYGNQLKEGWEFVSHTLDSSGVPPATHRILASPTPGSRDIVFEAEISHLPSPAAVVAPVPANILRLSSLEIEGPGGRNASEAFSDPGTVVGEGWSQ